MIITANSEKFYLNHVILSTGDRKVQQNPADRPFITLNHSIKEREKKQLRFAKCTNCGRVTPYRLNLLKGKRLTCKSCNKPLTLTRL